MESCPQVKPVTKQWSDREMDVKQHQGPDDNRQDRRADRRRGVQCVQEMVGRRDDDADHDPDHAAQRNLSPPHHTRETSPSSASRPARRRTFGPRAATKGAECTKERGGRGSPF
ncbi:MAG: hypothetical protein QOJ52_1919 [Acidimicrobiaceae bacterium]|nr:hypothetical protein [Acidimicrobiaceae bacterium]